MFTVRKIKLSENRRKRGKKKAFSFPFLSPFLFKKRKGSRKRNGFLLAPFSSILPLKREEKKQKEGEKRIKRKSNIFFLSPAPSPSRRRKEKEKEGNDPFFFPFRTKENGKRKRKNTRWQGHGKEKDLVYRFGKQGLKLCGFILNETIIVFVQMRAIWFCWNIVM